MTVLAFSPSLTKVFQEKFFTGRWLHWLGILMYLLLCYPAKEVILCCLKGIIAARWPEAGIPTSLLRVAKGQHPVSGSLCSMPFVDIATRSI